MELRRLWAVEGNSVICYGAGVPVDVVVVPSADVERYKDSHGLVIKPAQRKGKVIHEVG